MKKIVVLGGGYGGVVTSKHLAKLFKKDKDVQIQLIDRNPYHTLLTELHEVAANRAPEDSVKIELKKIFAGQKVDVVLDSIDNIDFGAKKLRSAKNTYSYDYLVIGTGCKPTFFGIPGAEEHALTLWSYEDAVRLKEQVRRMFSEAAKVTDPVKRRKMLTFVVVGAGFTGVELVGELAEFRDELCKEFYIDAGEVRLVVADMAPKILPILPDKLIQKAAKRLHKMNVEIITSAKITGVTPASVQLGDRGELEADTIVWTAGVEGSELVGKLDVKQEGRKRIVTNDKLQSIDHEDVYVVGDNIFYIPEGETRPVPQMVENAEQAGPLIAHNIYADVHGKPKKSYKPGFHGTMVCIGSRYGVANVGLPNKMFMLSGFMAMLSKHMINMYYLFTVAGFAKVWTYMMHEFFHVNNRRSFVGGHFAKRSPNFWLLPLRLFVGYKWLEEGLDKLPKIMKEPSKIFLIPAPPQASDVVSAASEAAGKVTETVDAQAAASAVESASTAVTALPVPGFIKSIVSWFMDVFFYTSDGGYTALATVFQFFMVFMEIALGVMIIVGLFTAIASAATVALGVMIWSSSMASAEMLWYMTAGVALIGGSGSAFGLDYYVLPWLKKQWKKIPLVRRWYLYTE
ncbi:MAG: FAD-dependent oxidoreductase [Paenibacillus macerans]|uniref:NADH:ubiquinone reductase (non-electrogenic) n=1 Tax=Paenibacillus macerans TaxID=44252 RepID=A0A090ZB29_PAEMA|nr:FAD-dependent oxidoreductase [Paenibacillus macerans]KFN07568.1 FAD dependent oxidoreductase family protein [Paenibacillus macerans]MBS5914767.1 FAD-dependent oxidoreductase [Paenibacillus macerans]MCY7561348.1 FAD-dependent oxidoreductase [Paenibacillus macerans]MDU7477216.1 FAD-dependent oxidoreductase [Paenibacillus macerans]MEC0140680.1 FAD-dependent oxidoreductase [Paenibacillus macerans]